MYKLLPYQKTGARAINKDEKQAVISYGELLRLRPRFEDVLSSFPTGLEYILRLILFGPDGNLLWERTHPVIRELSGDVMDEVNRYWAETFYDHTYGFYRESVDDMPYRETMNYISYVIKFLIQRIQSVLTPDTDHYGYQIKYFEVKRTYFVIHYTEFQY